MPPSTVADALFASSLQPSEHPTVVGIREAVALSLRRHGGRAGCAALVAAEFGEHPETAVVRMRWALAVAALAVAV
jgi:hypothetical protein